MYNYSEMINELEIVGQESAVSQGIGVPLSLKKKQLKVKFLRIIIDNKESLSVYAL